MTVTTDLARVAHVANGSARTFSFAPMQNVTPQNVRVTLVPAAGAPQVLSFPSDFSIEAAGVTLLVAPAAGVTVVIQRIEPLTQPDNFVTNAPFPAEALEARLDRIVMAMQQLGDQLSRSIQASIADIPPSSLPLPPRSARANRLLGFDANGAPQAVPGAAISGILVSAFTEGLLGLTSSGAWRAALGVTALSEVGLGNIDAPLPPNNNLNDATSAGLYRTTGTTLNRPGTDTGVLCIRVAADQRLQIAASVNTVAPNRAFWFRSQYADASWSPWTEMASRAYVDSAVGSASSFPQFLLMNQGVV